MSEFKQSYFSYFPTYQFESSYETLAKNAINQRIENEIQALRRTFSNEEIAYVEEMLSNNPVVVERRKLPMDKMIATTTTSSTTATSASVDYQRTMESLQRAESCRKSRINNKVKKARIRFRHQFANQKMLSSASMENRLERIIENAELQLLHNGVSPERLRILRVACNMNRPQTSPSSPLASLTYWQ